MKENEESGYHAEACGAGRFIKHLNQWFNGYTECGYGSRGVKSKSGYPYWFTRFKTYHGKTFLLGSFFCGMIPFDGDLGTGIIGKRFWFADWYAVFTMYWKHWG